MKASKFVITNDEVLKVKCLHPPPVLYETSENILFICTYTANEEIGK